MKKNKSENAIIQASGKRLLALHEQGAGTKTSPKNTKNVLKDIVEKGYEDGK